MTPRPSQTFQPGKDSNFIPQRNQREPTDFIRAIGPLPLPMLFNEFTPPYLGGEGGLTNRVLRTSANAVLSARSVSFEAAPFVIYRDK